MAYSIDTYNAKRDFNATPEPGGKTGRRKKRNLSFVIQKHAASRLHYDFRLEMDGVLKSWAIPKGPSLNPSDKRLAVRTEDHPLDYAAFEGVIPEHHYGAGHVIIWDSGEWVPETKDPLAALQQGKLSFTLKGERLSGQWTLARMGGTRNEGKENWLLIKGDDAIASRKNNITKANPGSIKSEITIEQMKAKKNTASLDTLLHQFKGPQLAMLGEKPPSGKHWMHEVKYDGYRVLVFVSQGKVAIRTRNGHVWTHKFPVLEAAIKKLNLGTLVLDGEAVMVDADGLTDFKALQNALSVPDAPMQLYLFDLLFHDGTDHTDQPFHERRHALEALFANHTSETLHLSETFTGKSEQVIGEACKLGLEGIISKRLDAPYRSGRSKSWVKSKCIKRQEFVICGFLPASDNPKAIGALHLGYYKNKQLHYAGKVGTGFNQKAATLLFKKLTSLTRQTHPFAESPGRQTGTVWVSPQELCEVRFAAWTKGGKVRHASYQGLREDKAPEEIHKEVPMSQHSSAPKKSDKDITVSGVRISHPDRVIFPNTDYTKGQLAHYYAEMAEIIMPQIENRLISVVRCPGGIDHECFFQRGKGKGMPEHIQPIDVKHKNKTYDYMYISKPEGLVELVQMGVIEVHPWGSKIDKVDRPDRIVFDLDPDEGIPFDAIKLAAQDIKARLEHLGLESFVKTSGGKGLHVLVPIDRRHEWEEVKDFTRRFAERMVSDVPEAYTATMSKAKRHGKIFIDYFRNDYAATSVMDYGVRSRPGAPVATPLFWKELSALTSAHQFDIPAVLKRKKQARTWLKEYQSTRQSLTKSVWHALS